MMAGIFNLIVCRPPSTLMASPSIASLEANVPCAQYQQRRQHLTGLIAVVIDRLLAHDNETGLFGVDNRLENFRNRKRLDHTIRFHKDAAIGAHGEGSSNGFQGLGRTDRYRHDLGRLAGFFQTDGLFDCNLVKGIHRHLDVSKFDAGAVRLSTLKSTTRFQGHQTSHDPPSGWALI